MTHGLVDATLTDCSSRGWDCLGAAYSPTAMRVYSNGYIKQEMHTIYYTLHTFTLKWI